VCIPTGKSRIKKKHSFSENTLHIIESNTQCEAADVYTLYICVGEKNAHKLLSNNYTYN
jgi:hypothetical protein